MALGTSAIVALAVTAASTAYQYKQQKKMKKKAREAAEARKGFEIVSEGEVIALPIVYGKAKIAGTRVFHKTFNGFSSPEEPDTFEERNLLGDIYKSIFLNISSQPYSLSSNADVLFQVADDSFFKLGDKNEFLIFQQALCQGPIHACKDVVIDDSIYLNSPSLAVKAGFVAAVHYAGNKADSIAAVAAPERKDAIFTDTAYATVVIKLNRDDPQFSGVPDVAFFVEGKLVRSLANGQLGPRVYSNNPALVLLDYLLDYRKLSPDQVDLASFQEAANTCNKLVLSNAIVGGNLYRPALSSSFQQTRDLSLYECNIVLDSAKPHRENVEAILETMGDARLVWSQGKYKLSLQYPGVNNQGISIADYITDERLVLGEDISISWPSAEERYNNVVVRFSNESENFKEDTVSWPPKKYGVYERGIGGFVYPAVSGWDSSEGGRFLNNYAVWNGTSDATSVVYKIKPKISGNYKLEFAMDDSGSINIAGQAFTKAGGWNSINIQTISLNADTIYTININGGNGGGGLKGVAARLTGPDNLVIWTTRDPSYTDFETVERDDSVYLEMLAEDNSVELETDLFFEGCTDYYHALAKAEEVCRTSRTAFTIKFTYLFGDRYLEPGDIVSFASETVKLGSVTPILIRVDSVKLKNGLTAEIEGTRFDWTQLAWNVADNEYIKPNPSYDSVLPAPLSLTYEPADNLLKDTAGSLVWPLVDDTRVSSYELLVVEPDDLSGSGSYNFKSLGLSPTSPFALPALSGESYIFGVRSVANSGAKSSITTTSQLDLSRLAPPKATNLLAEIFGEAKNSVRLSWVIPEKREDDSVYKNHFLTEIYKSKTDDFSTAKKISDVFEASEYFDSITDLGEIFYWVVLVSYGGVKGLPSDSTSIVLNYDDLGNSTIKPPSTLNLSVAATFTQMILMWDIPQYSEGGGHKATIIYAQKFKEGLPEPSIASAQIVARLEGYITQYLFPAALGEKWYFFAREQNNYGGISEGYAGPAIGQTGLIGGHDLGPLVVEAENIADGGITAQKFIEGIEPVVLWEGASLPTTNKGAVLTWNGKLYRWDGAQYTASVPTVDLVGEIVSTQIADAAINTAKFAQGIEPVSIVTSLPTTKTTNTVFYNGKLYRWDGAQYTASVPTVDLVGEIVGNQIADAVIDTAKFAQGIEPISIVTSLPTSKTTNTVFYNSKLYRWNGTSYVATVPAADVSGQLTSEQISEIAAAKLTGQITNTQISDNAISAPKISAGAITTAKLAAGAITTEKLAAGAVTADTIAAGTITGNKIAAGTITGSNIAADTITAGQIAAGAVSTSELAAGAVNASKIAAGTITANEIAGSTITGAKIAAGTITGNKIAAGTITGSNIAADTITAGQIAAGAVSTSELAAGAVNASKIAAGTITSDKIAANAITSAKIATDAITSDKIAANAITSSEIAANAITAAKIATGAIVSDKIAAGAIVAGKIGAAAVGATNIMAGTIVANSAIIANGAITKAKIGTAAVDTLQIAGNAVTVPVVDRRFDTISGAGMSTLHRVAQATITLDAAGWVYAIFTANQTYGSGLRDSITVLNLGGQTASVGGQAVTTNIAVSDAAYLNAGTHTVYVDWKGQDSAVRVTNRVLFVMGVMR